MVKQFVVLGAGRFGTSVAIKLVDLGAEVMIVDNDDAVVQSLADKVTYAVKADVTQEAALNALGLRNFDTAIVTIGGDIKSSTLVTLMLKEMGIKNIIAKAQDKLHAKVLYKIGADRVVFPEKEMGIRIAKNLMASNVMDFIELSDHYSMVEVNPLESWIGKSIQQIDVRRSYGLNIVGIKKGKDMKINLMPDYVIERGDILIVIGNNQDLKEIENKE
ncbi:MAG: TrkA family potassium uptake protein [Bacillota bacterium]|nr:TrkA family potassium uptake protein [Bacillota bacterium]